MYVQDVRTRRVQHVPQLGVDPLRGVRLRKAAKFPVVHELDDCQPVVPAPSERAMRCGWIVLSSQDEHRGVPTQLLRELEGVNLRARAVARQEVVDRVKNPHASPLTAPRLPQAADSVPRNRPHPESQATAIALPRTSWRPNDSRERSSRRDSRAACGQGRCSHPS